MRFRNMMGASVLALAIATPAYAQDNPQADEDNGAFGGDIVVTAQRQSERLQDVPIAVSAFSAESLEAQQIENTSDLQLTLPNVTFTKGNFTSASFTIRGIGDLCVGVSCDSATAIHMNDAPLFGTRLFETEFFDLEQIEVLRGPQGTLYGRNATSGVVNSRTARPDLSGFAASGEAEYGNYNSIRLKGMVNIPIGETLGVRFAGFFLERDGYTLNQFNGEHYDDRSMYAVRGSLRWEPSDNTTVDLMGYYWRENDNRMRIQKTMCQNDPTGVLGCLPNARLFENTNTSSTFTGTLTSREFLAVRGIPTAFGLGSLYDGGTYLGLTNPADYRTISTAYEPSYFSDELIIQGRLEHEFDNGLAISLSGNYQKVRVDSQQDYNNAIGSRAGFATALNTLAAAAAGNVPGLPASYFSPIAAALIPNGPTGNLCTSLQEETGTGSFGGHRICSANTLQFDRSNQDQSSWTAEAIISSDWDGPFNFLLGGIYADFHLTENSYYVNSFAIDYVTGILGSFTALGSALPPAYLGTPFFRNHTDDLTVNSWGVFGEAYYEFNDDLKLTVGIRYNDDQKSVRARSTLASFLVPYNSTSAFSSPYVGSFDADPGIAGNQLFQERDVSFSEWTGRAVLDYQITPDNLLYFSYSRGYKSGGINPPLQPIFAVPDSFTPESVNAFEIGSKNRWGALQLNLTAFYYQYQDLQLSRIVARTSVNDNVDANIYGLEAEAIITPTRDLAINLGFSYLNTKVSSDKFLSNPRDPSGGRSDAVIIKDITNGSNCAVVANTAGNVAGVNGFVNAVNAGLGLRPTTSFGANSGLTANGAFGICSVLAAQTANPALAPFGGMTVENAGVAVNIRGNELPQAPNFKFSVGAQYTIRTATDMTIVPRIDFAYTGDSYGNIFGGRVNEINGYGQANAQIQVNGPDNRWFARAFVQNIFDSASITGLYVTDQSSGLFTNVFTLEPRRYGLAVGFKF
ncbi:TonB-dependent receptor [Sphingomonas lacunae]|uniref:TonB-dependent receptor n=1 Tax=Sphingomonas lacunae TaxID=2698828 RepID=A0A6M4AWU5_9SPHN|nr:TonB-dependent receptor [Sphingomonas lacunae]QJQ33236.1 TonB-dependent receptor [Sphingomonas lacunae]